MTKIISIVSGKGGSGKSLLSAVLGKAIAREGKKVILIDLDIFVRGLTVLLFSFSRLEKSHNKETVSSLLGVYDKKSEDSPPAEAKKANLSIQRFFECDVLPAVESVGAPLDYDDTDLSNEEHCTKCIRAIINSLVEQYDYIILDNRAGMDSLVSASCKASNIVLTVAEDDEVGKQTNANLSHFIRSKGLARSVYTIINKGRGISNYTDVQYRQKIRSEFTMLGVVPFDMEVLENFGSEKFWSVITETLYFRALIDAWNNLSEHEEITKINENKYSFAPKIFMNKSQGRFTLIERMLFIYGSAAALFGGTYWVYKELLISKSSLIENVPLIAIGLGVISILMSASGLISKILRPDSSMD